MGLCTHTEGGDTQTWPCPTGCTQPHGSPQHPLSGVPGSREEDGWLAASLPSYAITCPCITVFPY